MKSFFSNMNLARWIMLVALVLSLALGVTGYTLHQRRMGLGTALKREIPDLAQTVQVLSRRYSSLYAEAEREGFKGQTDPQTYFRTLATHEKVMLGGVDIRPLADSWPRKGVIDKKYTIKPQTADRGFDRKNIANFMWLIEESSRRVRVSHIRLTRERNLKPWEFGNDRWKWDIEVTSRQKDDS